MRPLHLTLRESAGPTERSAGDPLEGPLSEAHLSGSEVRQRAVRGAALVGVRGVLVRFMGLAGSVALARLLVPADFGVVAFGTTLVTFATFLADAGLVAGLIRRPEEPERADLQAVLGLQLLAITTLAVAVASTALLFGTVGRVVAVMFASLPFTALRTPSLVVFERRLDYRAVVLSELAGSVAFNVWAISTVLAGAGVWGLATAVIVREAVSSLAILLSSPVRSLAPRIDLARIRGLLSFGARYQAISLAIVIRDQGLNLGTAAIAGVSVLGLWSLAYKIVQVPFLLFSGLWRVSFPAMSRLVAAGEDLGPTLERGVQMSIVATAVIIAPLVGASPAAIPRLFGPEWAPAADVLPPAALGLIFSGPVSTAAAGYLYAVGDADRVLRGVVLHTVAWMLVAFSLLPALGVAALGWGQFAAATVESVVFTRAIRRRLGVRLLRRLVPLGSIAILAGATGWLVAQQIGETLFGALLGAGVAELLFLAGAIVVAPRILRSAVEIGLQAFRSRTLDRG